MTLTGFLLARIAVDEALARAPIEPYDWPNIVGFITDEFHDAGLLNGESLARAFSPARVLAECEAKRRIVALHARVPIATIRADDPFAEGPDRWGWASLMGCAICDAAEVSHETFGTDLMREPFGPCLTLRLLAAPYADHPDYDAEWRP